MIKKDYTNSKENFLSDEIKDLQNIFYNSPISIQVFSPDGKTRMVNNAWEKLWQTKRRDIINIYNIRKDKQLIEKNIMPYIERAFKGDVVAIPPIEYVPDKTIPGISKLSSQWVKATMYPIKDVNGNIKYLILQHENITAEKRKREKETILSEISRVLGESIDYKTTIQNVGKILVPAFADYVRIVLVNEKKDLQDLAVFHKDTSKLPLVKTLYETYKDESNHRYGVRHILQTGTAEIMQKVEGEKVEKSTEKIKQTVKALNLRSYMGIPLKLRKRIIGVITFSSVSDEKIYTQKDLELAGEIALRISFAIENSRLFQVVKHELLEKEKFQSEQAQLAAMLDQTFDAIILREWRGKIVYWNKGAEELYGYSKKEAIGERTHSLLKTVHPVPFSKIENALLKTGRWEGELQHMTKYHKQLIVSSRKILVTRDAENKFILETNRDITRQKNAQLGQAQLAAIVNFSEDAIISTDLNSIVKTWNHAAEKMSGYKAEEAIGKPIFFIIPKDRYNEEEKIITKLKLGERIKHFETVRMTKSGKRIDVSLTVSPIFDEKGRIISTSKIARNITQEIRFQNNLRFLSEASKLFFSSLDYKKTLQNIAQLAVPKIADWVGVDMKTETGIEQLAVVHINPEKVKWAKELNRKNPPDPSSKTGVPNVLRTGKSEFVPNITDKMLVQAVKNKEQLNLLRKLQLSAVMIVPIQFGKKILGAISFVSAESGHNYTKSDLTIAEELAARAAIAIENAKLYTNAKEAIDIRDQFISLASHELKTPITSLKMYAQVLGKQYEKDSFKNLGPYIQKIEQQTDKLTLLINDLLNVSKIKHGKLDFNMDSIDLNVVIKETVDVEQQMTQKHNILIDGKIDKKVYADQYRIYQVLTNLLSNAIKYSPQSDKIIIHVTSEKNKAVVNVEDFGMGINEVEQKKIFSQFYRIISPGERIIPGLGMGLYISQEIIKRHGGTMRVISAKGRGSRFIFTLPLYP